MAKAAAMQRVADETELESENATLRARVAALEAQVETLSKLADSDTLTPLPNRRFFVRAVERAIAELKRHATPAALLFVDVDDLKAVNDAHGHQAGDEALIHVADVLQRMVRASDVVARIGGDEFGLLLGRIDADGAREKAVALCEAINAHPSRPGLSLAVSIGVTALRPDDTSDAAIARADGDMYRVKRRR